MQDVLSEINKLYETLKAKDKKLQDLISNTQEQLVILNKVKSDQDARDKSLEDREFKVSKIESVVALKTEATRMLNEAKEIHDKTIAERAEFKTWVDKERADIAQCRAGADSCLVAIKEREEGLEKEKKQLALDKVTYRENIIREIGKMTSANT